MELACRLLVADVNGWLRLSMATTVGAALARPLAVDAVLVEFTGSPREVPDTRMLMEASGGAAIFWLIGHHDAVATSHAVEAGVSGAFYPDQVEPAEAFLRRIEMLSCSRMEPTISRMIAA